MDFGSLSCLVESDGVAFPKELMSPNSSTFH